MEAENQFASKEAEEEARKEPAKTFTPGEVSTPLETPIEDQVPKVVAPTPEQILAIKGAFHALHLSLYYGSVLFFSFFIVLR